MAAKGKGWGIEVQNLEESLAAFSDADAAFGATPLKECLMQVAYRVRDRAKQLVSRSNKAHPPQYPHLQDAIFAASGKPKHPSVIVGVDRKKAPHAHLVEFGHGGPHPAPAHPFLRPASDTFRASAVSMVGREINERIIKKLLSRRRTLRTP